MVVNVRRTGDIQSVHRALDILELVCRSGTLGVTEIANELGLAISTAHNIVRTLARRDYLAGEDGRYRPGPAITVLTSQSDPVSSLSSAIRPVLQQLSTTTGHAATATALLGHDARLIGFDPGPGAVTVSSTQWTWRNPLALATGRILVATTRAGEWDDFISAGRDAEPGWTVRQWQQELQHVADTGVCVKAAASPQEAIGVGVPIWARGQAVICSIGCSAPAFLTNPDVIDDMVRALWETSRQLSARLGCETIPEMPASPARPTTQSKG